MLFLLAVNCRSCRTRYLLNDSGQVLAPDDRLDLHQLCPECLDFVLPVMLSLIRRKDGKSNFNQEKI
jgi:hypothetical protein